MLTPFERGFIAHLIADWLFQNDWMAKNKTSLRHPSAWIHGLVYAIVLGIALGWMAGLVLSIAHIFIDTRIPLNWWRSVFRQTGNGPTAMSVAIWVDQALHLILIGVWVAFI